MYAERINSLPPYLFADIDRKKREAENRGVDIIDMGVGDPDLPTPSHIVDALCKAAAEPANHRYPSYEGMFTFREAVADWYRRRKHVSLDPDSEVLTLIGSKEGIAHSTFAFLNPHDIALVPNPAYPVYKNAVIMADSKPFSMPLMEESGFKPDFERIDAEIAKSN